MFIIGVFIIALSHNVFIEPNKKFAKKLRKGQAQSLQWKYNRYSRHQKVIIEPVE